MADFKPDEDDLVAILKRLHYFLTTSIPYNGRGRAVADRVANQEGEFYGLTWSPTHLKLIVGRDATWRYLFPENDGSESDCETMVEALDYVDALVEAARQERLTKKVC